MHLVKFVLDSFINKKLSENSKGSICHHVSDFCRKLFKRQDNKCHRIYDIFLKNNSSWLNKDIVFPLQNMLDPDTTSTSRPRGHLSQNFEDSSVRSKKQKIEELQHKYTSAELVFAIKTKLKAEGEGEANHLNL